MLIINDASAAGVSYWQRSAVHSVWLGRSAPVLGLSGVVESGALRDVLLGRQPGGGPITVRPGLRRRHGWDLVFGAPKSVSLLAQPDLEAGAALRLAFRQAVQDAVTTLEDNAAWVRCAGRQVRAHGVVAGAFEHVSSDAGQPHLHAHVVLANLGANGDGGFGCLVGNELWRWREAIGPAFQLALRSHLTAAGFGFEWELGAGGMGEIIGVPRPDRDNASARSLAVRARARSFGSASAGAARTAQARTRVPQRLEVANGGGHRPDPEGGCQAGNLGREQAAAILARARARPALPAPPPAPVAVERALAERNSTFAEPDVIVALAETCPSGLSRQQVAEFSRRWCETSLPAPGGRWTSPLARLLDAEIMQSAAQARRAHLAEVNPAVAWPELAALGFGGQAAEVAVRLACSGEGISVLPRGPWLAQAACIDAARAVWQAAGISVHVSSPSELSERRWRALTSLRPPGAGASGRGPAGRRVLVVDAADHLSPAAMARLCNQAGASGTKVVLVAGGTVPGAGASLANSFDRLVEDLLPGGLSLTARAAVPSQPTGPAVSVDGLVVRGALAGADALAHLVADWRAAGGTPGQAPAVMVAFGPAEVDALNEAGRRARLGTGWSGAEVVLGERAYALGDEVLALRRLGTVRSATGGTVVAVGARSLTVEWRGPSGLSRSVLGQEHAKSLGYGYATTVPYLRSWPTGPGSGAGTGGVGTLFVLGDPLQLGSRASLAGPSWVTLAGPGMPAPGPAGAMARYRAGIAQLATSWPDAEMLDRAGPRPLNAGAHRRWAEVVTNCALERQLGLTRGGLGLEGARLGAGHARLGGLRGLGGLGDGGGTGDQGGGRRGPGGLGEGRDPTLRGAPRGGPRLEPSWPKDGPARALGL